MFSSMFLALHHSNHTLQPQHVLFFVLAGTRFSMASCISSFEIVPNLSEVSLEGPELEVAASDGWSKGAESFL